MKRKNIVVLVCLGWCLLLPTLNNLFHYVRIDHQFGQRSDKLEWVSTTNTHYCEHYLGKLSSAVMVEFFSIDFVAPPFYGLFLILSILVVQDKYFLFFWLRGPPWGTIYLKVETQNQFKF